MHRLIHTAIAIAMCGLLSSPIRAHARQAEQSIIDKLAWMEGRWVRAADDGSQLLEETWSSPRDGSMVGMFRWNRGGKMFMCELMTIALDGDKPVFRLRHFDAALRPWEKESPLTYPMKSIGDREVIFENPDHAPDNPRRFIYAREGDQLTVRLENADGGGDAFVFQRAGDGRAQQQQQVAAPDAAKPASPVQFEGAMVLRLLTTDRAKSRDWYRDMLGFEVLFEVDEIGWTEIANREARMTIGLLQSDSVNADVPGTVPVIGVRDLDAARTHLESKGVKFEGPTTEHPGLVKLATMLDPDGNRLMLYESLAG